MPRTALRLRAPNIRSHRCLLPVREQTGKTNSKGVLTIHDVPLGKIRVEEIKAPNGYKLDSTAHEYKVKAGSYTVIPSGEIDLEPEDDFKENPVSFDIEIAKTKGGEDDSWESDDGKGNAAAGVQFQIVSNTTEEVVGTLTTNDAGFASTKDAATCDETSTSDDKTDDPSRPWFGSGKRNAGITGAVPYDAAGYTIREVDSTVPEGFDHVDDWTISADDLVDGTTKYYSVIDNDAQQPHPDRQDRRRDRQHRALSGIQVPGVSTRTAAP